MRTDPFVPTPPISVLLVASYELGRQPFGIASAAAWLDTLGARVECLDLAVQHIDGAAIERADVIAFFVPMHTATRIAVSHLPIVRKLNPHARICFFGLYAPLNEAYLRESGVHFVIGPEFEADLAAVIADQGRPPPSVPSSPRRLPRLRFKVPDRSGLPGLSSYAQLRRDDEPARLVGYTEATRGCKHLCKHCPIVPVYEGRFRVVQRDVVLEDVRNQVAAGAGHITFGDPDFLNAPAHAVKIVEALHSEFPEVTYDVTIKVEHLLRHPDAVSRLEATGCAFVTTAVEWFEDDVLSRLGKGHTRADIFRVADVFAQLQMHLNPTFLPFTPWMDRHSYLRFLQTISDLGWIDNVAPIQYTIRLLIPDGSKVLDDPDARACISSFDRDLLSYPWKHADPRVDLLHQEVLGVVQRGQVGSTRGEVFERVLGCAAEAVETRRARVAIRSLDLQRRAPVPYLTEPWYC